MSTKFSERVEESRVRGALAVLTTCLLASTFCGCAALTQPIDGIPAERLPADFFPEPKNNLVPVDISILSIEPPRDYQLGPGDILGIYIDGVMPFNPPNQPPAPPPVNFPDSQSTLPPSIGYPIPVQEDGTLSLPLIEPINVNGLTIDQVRDAIRDEYIAQDILRSDKARPIVTLIAERTYNVIVIREDNAVQAAGPTDRGGIISGATGGLVKLKAYENDILHALVQTGGLPGLNAKNEVKVLRASLADQRKRAQFMRAFLAQQQAVKTDPCACPPKLPDDPSILRIPLRVKPDEIPDISPDDVRLGDGDIVYIESRETEVFYTGGLLPGGEFPLPRDYDLDVIGAISITGGSLFSEGNRFGGGGGGGRFGGQGLGLNTQVPPGLLYILRKTPCDGQIAIEVDLAKALNDPRSRPLVQPGDILVLRYKCEEQLINFGTTTFFTFGIAELLRGNN